VFKFIEKHIIKRVRAGDQIAFSKIYQAYEQPIYRFIYFRVSDKEKAQDLTSEVFIKVLDCLKNSQSEIGNFRAFIYKTARNLIIDFYRTRKFPLSLEEIRDLPSREDLKQKVEKSSQLSQIKKYFQQLKPEYQEPVLLHFFAGLPYKEVAKILGESEANVKMRSYRGIKALKVLLNQSRNPDR